MTKTDDTRKARRGDCHAAGTSAGKIFSSNRQAAGSLNGCRPPILRVLMALTLYRHKWCTSAIHVITESLSHFAYNRSTSRRRSSRRQTVANRYTHFRTRRKVEEVRTRTVNAITHIISFGAHSRANSTVCTKSSNVHKSKLATLSTLKGKLLHPAFLPASIPEAGWRIGGRASSSAEPSVRSFLPLRQESFTRMPEGGPVVRGSGEE